ncbi:MAG: patatin-like phospholipase family protein [Burkholderiales bacterium]|nr:patatin-like phospholipase family protein [Burkholderiales bacterium]
MNKLPEIFLILGLLYWLIYSVTVIIYLNYLTRKYLYADDRNEIVGEKQLQSFEQLQQRYKDTNEINILVLTGGGIRGLIPLETLTYIEEQTGKKVGELFDFFSGTSTGAISVSSFVVADDKGNYKFSAKDLKDKYVNHSKKMFSSPWYHQYLTFFGLFAPRYLPDSKIEILHDYFGNSTIGELAGNILIPVYNIDKNCLQMVKNWNPPYGESNGNYLTKDLINGASSPPMLFSPVAFGLKNQSYLFIDPAVILNNPVLHVTMHVRSLFPTKKLNIVLVGNGGTSGVKFDYRSMFGFGLYGVYQYLFSAPVLSNKLYVDFMEEYFKDAERFDDKISYIRISSSPTKAFSPTDTSDYNISKLEKFSKQMLEENIENVNRVIEILKRRK